MSDGRRAAPAPPPVAQVVGSAAPKEAFLAPTSRWSRIRPGGWEIALWVFGLLLTIASIQANVTAMQSQMTGMTAAGCTDQACLIYTQSMMMLSPAALTAGLVAIALALAIRALAARGPAAATRDERPTASGVAQRQDATHTTAPSPVPAPANQPTPAFPPATPTFLTPPAPTAPGASRSIRSQADAIPAPGADRPIAPAAEPDRVTPVPVTPVRGVIPPRTPAGAPRRRADADNSIYMRPTPSSNSRDSRDESRDDTRPASSDGTRITRSTPND